MQDIETGTLLMDWNALNRAGKSHAKLFVGVSHELNSFADCERNTSECVQSTRQIRKCRKVCFSKLANGSKGMVFSPTVSFTDCRICKRSRMAFRSAGQTRFRSVSILA